MGGRAVPLFPEQNGPNRQGGAHPLSGCRQHFDIVSGGAPPQLGGFFAVGAGAIVSAPAPSRWWHKSLGPGVARWGHFSFYGRGLERAVGRGLRHMRGTAHPATRGWQLLAERARHRIRASLLPREPLGNFTLTEAMCMACTSVRKT